MGLIPGGPTAVNYMIEMPNRGKKSIGIDLTTPGGQEVVYELAKNSDVFLTSYLPGRRKHFGIEVEQIRAANADIIYVRGSGYGPQGPDADRPGYDGVSFWSRGGIAAALYKRKSTGETSIVDVSLLGLAAWAMTPQVTAAMLYGGDPIPTFTHRDMPNPLVGNYKTKDDRYITLMMLQGNKFYPEFMTVIGRADLISDERFADGHSRFENRGELIDILDEEFASRTADQWGDILKPLSGAWAVLQKPSELRNDPAVVANGYIPTVNAMNGAPYILPTNPVQFDGHHVAPTGAPEHGQHTEEIMLEAGIDWDKIEQYKQDGSVL